MPRPEDDMTKLLSCSNCKDVMLLLTAADDQKARERKCKCGRSQGQFLSDNHHALIVGPCICIGFFTQDHAEAFMEPPQNEAGYWPVRTWRIPHGDRIIVFEEDGSLKASCTRHDPCQYVKEAEGVVRQRLGKPGQVITFPGKLPP